ncbi:hypothetical protein tb265_00380 [Gemmatimonadetes bacterium T265]|nr:hypothetical protein tb265_00380 [Gemmatimonadetes bacterium T265]
MTDPLVAARALARACTARYVDLPLPALAVLIGHLHGVAAAVPPDDRPVLVALVEDGALDGAVRDWATHARPDRAQRALAAAWDAALARERLPGVPLPDLPWPEVLAPDFLEPPSPPAPRRPARPGRTVEPPERSSALAPRRPAPEAPAEPAELARVRARARELQDRAHQAREDAARRLATARRRLLHPATGGSDPAP